MSDGTLKEITRESSLGFHMINTFQNCPRKWYIKYICGILPSKTAKALIFGKAWHEGMEVFYKSGTADEAYLKVLSEIESEKENFKSPDEFSEQIRRVPLLFKKWHELIGCKLHDEYAVLDVEKELKPKLGDAFTMTIRPDAIVKHRESGTVFIPEHKTTGYSLTSQMETVTRGDQATAYCWGFTKLNPDLARNFGGVLLDVCYNRASVTDVKQFSIVRGRTSLIEFELSILGVFLDLSNRIRGLEAHPELLPMLFPRNGSACSSFGCEYEDICRNKITPGMVLGSTFIIDEWKGKEQLLADTEGERHAYRTFADSEGLSAIELEGTD